MDIVRNIILAVRNADDSITSISGISDDHFAHHAQLLVEAGLIMAALQPDGKVPARQAVIYRLTWDGQDFANSIIDETIWRKAKDNIINPVASWSFDILLEYLKFEIKSHIPGLGGTL